MRERLVDLGRHVRWRSLRTRPASFSLSAMPLNLLVPHFIKHHLPKLHLPPSSSRASRSHKSVLLLFLRFRVPVAAPSPSLRIDRVTLVVPSSTWRRDGRLAPRGGMMIDRWRGDVGVRRRWKGRKLGLMGLLMRAFGFAEVELGSSEI
jgi:hypothetical protein